MHYLSHKTTIDKKIKRVYNRELYFVGYDLFR